MFMRQGNATKKELSARKCAVNYVKMSARKCLQEMSARKSADNYVKMFP